MKILGHAYIATHALKGDGQLLITGSFLPEMLPYIPYDVFQYQELHEGGKKWLAYLDRHEPKKRDLALVMLSHGGQLGADKFSIESERFVSKERRQLIKEIAQANSLDFKLDKLRLHNYIGLGIDWLLVQNEPQLVKEVQGVLREVDVLEVSRLLASGFGKDEARTQKMVATLIEKIYRPEDLTSIEGLARIWARQAAGLPEKDQVDLKKASRLIQTVAKLLEKDWREFLKKVELEVSKNLRPFLI